MLSFLKRYALVISVLLFLSLLLCVWLFPSSGLIITILFLLCGFVLTSLPIVEKHRHAYLEGKTSHSVYIRNILFDLVGILLALITAALLGRYIAAIATEQIGNDLTKLIAGIIIGLLIGLVVGTLVKQAWTHTAKKSPEN